MGQVKISRIDFSQGLGAAEAITDAAICFYSNEEGFNY